MQTASAFPGRVIVEFAARSRRLSLRPLACCLALFLGPVLAARAAVPCPPPAVLDVAALQSELMVVATTCHENTGYNAFMQRYRPYLLHTEQDLSAYFRRVYGRAGQQRHDSFVTSLANAQSDAGIRQGADFCARNQALFQEVQALRSTNELPLYAAGKDVLPAEVLSCSATETRHARQQLARRSRR